MFDVLNTQGALPATASLAENLTEIEDWSQETTTGKAHLTILIYALTLKTLV